MGVFTFFICMGCGLASGVVYDVFYVVRCTICGTQWQKYSPKDVLFTAVCDVLYFAILSVMFLFTTNLFHFYGLRAYMFIGCVLGVLLYLKSIHFLIAFLVKKVYNQYESKRRKL